MLWMLLTAGAMAAEPPEFRVDGDFAVHTQIFAAPGIRGLQVDRAFALPVLEGEVEVRRGSWGVRAHAGLWPLPLVLDAGVMVLNHLPSPDPASTRFLGVEAGAARAYYHTRFYAGPTAGLRGRWRMGALEGIAGARLTAGLALDRGSKNDWAFLTPGPALGLHGALVFTFAPSTL